MSDELRLRRLLCIARHGRSAYLDDGEASDASEHPSIDYLRDSLDEIEAKWMQRARAKVDAPPATSAEQRPIGHLHKNGDFCQERGVVSAQWPVPLYAAAPAAIPSGAREAMERALHALSCCGSAHFDRTTDYAAAIDALRSALGAQQAGEA